MNRHGLRLLILLVLTALAPGSVWEAGYRAHQKNPDQPVPGDDARAGDDAPMVARLAALRPDQPMAYFELAEEVASEADDLDGLRLAQHLYVLAFELDRADGVVTIAGGACLGLAELARHEHERRWLLTIASIVDPRYSGLALTGESITGASIETRASAAEALGLIRSGQGQRAMRLLEDPEIEDLLRRRDRRLSRYGVPGELDILLQQAALWPCPECRNRRVTQIRSGMSREPALCPVCRGNPGPPMTARDLERHLRFEAELLGVGGGSWGGQLLASGAAPLREPDPAALAAVYRVDPAKSVFRDGAWVAP